METPAAWRDYPVLQPLQAVAPDRGRTEEDAVERAQERVADMFSWASFTSAAVIPGSAPDFAIPY